MKSSLILLQSPCYDQLFKNYHLSNFDVVSKKNIHNHQKRLLKYTHLKLHYLCAARFSSCTSTQQNGLQLIECRSDMRIQSSSINSEICRKVKQGHSSQFPLAASYFSQNLLFMLNNGFIVVILKGINVYILNFFFKVSVLISDMEILQDVMHRSKSSLGLSVIFKTLKRS